MFERVVTTPGWQTFTQPVRDDPRAGPVVVWELRSMEVECWGGKRREPVDGALPAGYLILSERGRFVAAVGCGEPEGAAARENVALFQCTFPGVGEYRIDNGRLITRVSADEAEAAHSHECNLDGRWLEVASAWVSGDGEQSGIRRVLFGFQKMA